MKKELTISKTLFAFGIICKLLSIWTLDSGGQLNDNIHPRNHPFSSILHAINKENQENLEK